MAQNPDAIRAIVLDIDGVLTDGRLIPLADGDLLRIVDAKDSLAVRVAVMKGYVVGIISGGDTVALHKRMLSLGISEENLMLGTRGKMAAFRKFCAQNALKPEEVMYIGDDLPDVPVLEACGYGIAPADAAFEAKQAADKVSEFGGGKLCVRTEIEALMRRQGTWEFDYAKVF
ncbi:MAG: HAD hydrolase family protein [Bacteroidales bacterium]|nr:HAD hydrolase family protein [Bacteroidales bacterium]